MKRIFAIILLACSLLLFATSCERPVDWLQRMSREYGATQDQVEYYPDTTVSPTSSAK